MIADFGWIILDINHTEPRDSGEWTCVARNARGEAASTAIVNVGGKDAVVYDSIQPQSLDRIREIEAPKPALDELPPAEYAMPQIVKPFEVLGGLGEGESAHLEAHYTPIDDPRLKVGGCVVVLSE